MAVDRLKKSRSSLLAIGIALLVVLIVGGTSGVLAIINGDVIPYTAALVVVIASVALVLIAMVVAFVALQKVLAPDDDAAFESQPQGRGDRHAPWPEAPTTSDIMFSTHTGVHPGSAPRGEKQSPEVFSRIASRLHAKVSRAFVDLDALERRIEDPELLATVFSLDHLVTRIRREVENLSVLGGDVPQARSSQPAEVNQVLRLAVASTEHYQRIMTFPLRGVKIHGHVVAELINLLAELLDNATTFTPPAAPKIALTASRVAAGLAIEVHDRGIGMPPDDIERVNRLLAGYTDVDLHQLLGEGRIGFAVVNKIAPRHNIRVQLRANIFGGIDAAVVIPQNLLSEPEEVYGEAVRAASRRLEAGATGLSSPTAARSQRAPQPSVAQAADWPWPPSADPAGGLADDATNGRHSRAGAEPSPFPRSAAWMSDEVPDEHAPGTGPNPVTRVPPAATVGTDSSTERPPLPERGAESYLRPELREPPQNTRVSPGHNPDLLVEVTRGREDAELENSDEGH